MAAPDPDTVQGAALSAINLRKPDPQRVADLRHTKPQRAEPQGTEPQRADPLSDVVSLLQPRAPFSKISSGGGRWRVRREERGDPFYCAVLEGGSRLTVDGQQPITLAKGDFILIPAIFGFTIENAEGVADTGADPQMATFRDGETRIGDPDAPANVRSLIGHFTFGSPDAALLVQLLPQVVHVREQSRAGEEPRLATLGKLVRDEARADRPAREVVLARLLEIMLIEALRATDGSPSASGLLRGLADPRLAAAIRSMHERPADGWTVARLAGEAALSRSAFFERFNRAMGVAPMEYLVSWRMALARRALRSGSHDIAEIAERVGYSSASTFSTAFSRVTGLSPTRYAQMAGGE
ncbi:MAG: AraC family transcriptional regulator [Neorhizobium sp.]|nr:AraC family transcriptional regulator [Neorhizobium sp.]